MRIDPMPLSRRRTPRAEVGTQAAAALIELAGGHGTVTRHAERAWASATFAGTRHVLTLDFAGVAAVAAAERLMALLPDHEFALPGQIVIDATLSEVEHGLLPGPRLTLTCELLLLEES